MMGCLLNWVFNISTLAFSLWNRNLAKCLRLRKNSMKVDSKWFLSTIVSYRYHTPVFWFPTEKVIKPQPCRIWRQKTGSFFWLLYRQYQKSIFLYRLQKKRHCGWNVDTWLENGRHKHAVNTLHFLEQLRRKLNVVTTFGPNIKKQEKSK